ncbi:MAG: TolB family protein [Dehalococcoidia bacterium]
MKTSLISIFITIVFLLSTEMISCTPVHIERVSVNSNGDQANYGGYFLNISKDGRYIAFMSNSSNLVTGDTNNKEDIFVHDRITGLMSRVSVDSHGNQGNSYSDFPSISGDGRYVAFDSFASNLVTGDTNDDLDVFVHDCMTGITNRVSVDSNGNQSNSYSNFPSISDDGRYVAFTSKASNLVTGDTNGLEDVFVHDCITGVTSRVSVDSNGNQSNWWIEEPSISGDGRYVAFDSFASNLVTGDTNNTWDVFVHDCNTGITDRVSVDSKGNQGNGSSERPSINSNGRYVAFQSMASNLDSGDTNSLEDIFVHDLITGVTSRVSVDSSGAQGNGRSYDPSISGDGRFIAFHSEASNLVTGDTNGTLDIFVHDRITGVTSRVSVNSNGAEGNGPSSEPKTSGDGRFIAFASGASNLVKGDTNGCLDDFVVMLPQASSNTTPDIILIISGVLVLFLLIGGVIYMAHRRAR